MYAAIVGIIQVALAEAIGVTNFGGGFCCGYERDILPTYALIVWFGSVAACVGPLLAVRRDRTANRAMAVGGGAVGALLALPVVAYVAGRTPSGGDGDVGAPMMIRAYAIGVAFGVVIALLVELTPAYRTFVRGGLLITTAVLWLADVALTIGRNPLRLSPGGIGLGRIALSLGVLPYLVSTLLWGVLASTIVVRMRGRDWRRNETWLVAAAALVSVGLVVRLTLYLSDLAGPPLVRLGARAPELLSAGLLYAAIGVGVVLGIRHCADRPGWVALAAAAGFVLVAGAFRLAIAFGPALSGDGALNAGWYDIVFGLVAALIGGAAVGVARRPAAARPVPSSA